MLREARIKNNLLSIGGSIERVIMDTEVVHGKKKKKASLLFYSFKVFCITETRIASRYSDLLRLGRLGFDTLWRGQDFPTVLTGPPNLLHNEVPTLLPEGKPSRAWC